MGKLQMIAKARYLRHEETEAERLLWQMLRNNQLGVKFRRQHPLGNFILDFYAPSLKLAIELDGALHETNREYDKERTAHLAQKRIHVLRFWNRELEKDAEKVLREIKSSISALSSAPLQK